MLGSQPSGDIPHVIPFTASCSFPLVSAISCPAPGLVETLSGGIFPNYHLPLPCPVAENGLHTFTASCYGAGLHPVRPPDLDGGIQVFENPRR